MAIQLPPADVPTAAPGGVLVPAARLGGRRKAAVLMAALGARPRRGGDPAPPPGGDREPLPRNGEARRDRGADHRGDPRRARRRRRRRRQLGDVVGGMQFAREVLERALGAERAEELLARLSTANEMRLLRVPAPHPPRAGRRLPAHRVPADDRAGGRQPPHGPRRPGSRPSARATCSPTSPCASRAWARPAPP